MTTIAYRQGVMAGDRRACMGDHVAAERTKVHRRSDGALIGFCGRSAFIDRYRRWFLDGEQGQAPSLGNDDQNSAQALIVRPDGTVEFADHCGTYVQEGPYFATGSGWTAAMAAMDMGADAKLAVEIAAKRDTSTGDGVDIVSLATIAALEAPAHPLDELRTDPGSVEEVRDQFEASASGASLPTNDACALPGGVEESRDHLIDAQTCDPVDPRLECASDEPDALAEFMKLPGAVKWGGGECPVPQSAVVEYLLRGADLPPLDPKPAFLLSWDHADILGDIIAYRVVSEPAEQYDDPTAVAIAAYIEAENEAPAPEQPSSVEIEQEADIQYLNKPVEIEPGPYDAAVEKGAITQDEADFLVSERERIAADEQASFFAKGMMADADKHAKHDGPFAWLRKKVDA